MLNDLGNHSVAHHDRSRADAFREHNAIAAKHAFACPHGHVLAKVNSRAATATPLARDAVPALLSGSPELIAEEGILRADFAPRAFDIGHWNGNRQPDSFPRRVAPVLL